MIEDVVENTHLCDANGDILETDFEVRQQQFVAELNDLQEKYGIQLMVRTVMQRLEDDTVLVKGEIHAMSASDQTNETK